MSREFILTSGAHALNIGPDQNMGPTYNDRGEVDTKYGKYILMQMLPIVPQTLVFVHTSNILREVTKAVRPTPKVTAEAA